MRHAKFLSEGRIGIGDAACPVLEQCLLPTPDDIPDHLAPQLSFAG